MIGKTSQSAYRPAALGMTLQQSTYGTVIPVIFGRTKTALSIIWAANIRQTGSTGKKGKGKKSKKGKGAPQYAENVDFLVGHNPILGPLQFWENQNQKYPLNFVSTSVFYGAGTNIITISDTEFYTVIGVTVNKTYAITVNDYGGPGPVALQGTSETPLWNRFFRGPNPTRPAAFMHGNESYYWTPALGNVIHVESNSIAYFGANIYYAQLWPGGSSAYGKKERGTAVPAGALNLTFESVLGSGPEYNGTDKTTHQPLNRQQLLYPMYAGLGSDKFDMGTSTAMPDVRPEILGAYATYPTGDAEFADMLEDIVCQGISQSGASIAYAYDSTGSILTGSQLAASGIPVMFDNNGFPIELPSGPFVTGPTSKLQRGLGAYNYPGPVQMKYAGNIEQLQAPIPFTFDFPNTKGNIIVVAATADPVAGNVGSCSDSNGNQYVQAGNGGGYAAWYATNINAGANAVTVTGLGYDYSLSIIELQGVDTFDSSAFAPTSDPVNGQFKGTVTTTNTGGYPAYVLGFVLGGGSLPDPEAPLWTTMSMALDQDASVSGQCILSRSVYNPGEITLQVHDFFKFNNSRGGLIMLAFKSTKPSPYPKALGELLDQRTLNMTRRQCRAFGLFGSFLMDSQQMASDWMKGLYDAMNSAPVFSGFKLKSIPKSEVSYAGGGVLYTAYTSTGPVIKLKASDFKRQPGSPTILCERTARTDIPNILQIQFPNRSSDYYDTTIHEPESGSIAQYSPRKDQPKQFRMIQDPAVGRKVLNVLVKEKNLNPNTYKFVLNAAFKLLDPMDLITIPDPDTLLTLSATGKDLSIPLQLTQIEENSDLTLSCEAVPFIYGLHAPIELTVTPSAPNAVDTGSSPGSVNVPVIFEPVPRLLSQQNQGQIWIVVSKTYVPPPVDPPSVSLGTGTGLQGGTYWVIVTYVNVNGAESTASPESIGINLPTTLSILVGSPLPNPYATSYNVYVSFANDQGTERRANPTPIPIGTDYLVNAPDVLVGQRPPSNEYGGSIIHLSTDGGNTYNVVGQTVESAVTGLVTTDWPQATDPDTSDNLLLDLTECAGTLNSQAVVDEDNFLYPSYVEGGGTSFIPYELMSYAVATLTSAFKYTLSATTPNHLRRAVFGAPAVGVGADHPVNSRFAYLPPSAAGILKITMDPLWIGQQLYFKIQPVNVFGGGSPNLSDLTAYPYTPLGIAQYQNPNAVNYTNTPGLALSLTNPTTVHMVAVTVQFPGNAVHYNARDFTIPSLSTRYYVTIQDSGYLGDIGTALTRTAYIETTQAKVGAPGYIYMGSIGPAATAGGGTTPVVAPGGWPPQQQFLINGQ